jgi:hypothetical protein
MQINMGTIDRTLRVLAAIVIAVAWAFGYLTGIFAIVLLVIAGLFLFTSMVGVCPAYMPFRFSTKKK